MRRIILPIFQIRAYKGRIVSQSCDIPKTNAYDFDFTKSSFVSWKKQLRTSQLYVHNPHIELRRKEPPKALDAKKGTDHMLYAMITILEHDFSCNSVLML